MDPINVHSRVAYAAYLVLITVFSDNIVGWQAYGIASARNSRSTMFETVVNLCSCGWWTVVVVLSSCHRLYTLPSPQRFGDRFVP